MVDVGKAMVDVVDDVDAVTNVGDVTAARTLVGVGELISCVGGAYD